jgi:hypothetical protein
MGSNLMTTQSETLTKRKHTAKSLSFLGWKLEMRLQELKGAEKRVARLKLEIASIYKAACDADCENDGNAHRSECSIYKL